jgi:threonine dehydrogenase-like Zn-dependent dehydrogenase
MHAAVYSGIGSIEYREVDKPVIGGGEALLKVKAAAICGTDLRIFKSGHFAIKKGEERIMSHEFAGEISELGPDVKTYKTGTRVSVASNVGCGVCRYCRMGSVHLCPEYISFGITIDGAFAEYVKIPRKAVLQGNMIPFDEGTSFEEAALAEPLACCYNAYKSVGTVPGDAVLIVGTGPMGILHMQVNKLAGAGKLMIADISEPRLKLAEKYGPDVVINTEKEDLKEAVMKNTGGKGADVVITACPVPDIQRQSIELTAKMGRINLFGGLPKGKEYVPLNTNLIHYNRIIVTGTTGASIAHHQAALELITSGQIDTKSIISKRYKLAQIKEAFDYAMSGEGLKTIIEI